MSFFGNLFKKKSPPLHELAEWMINYADELERTYRGIVEGYHELPRSCTSGPIVKQSNSPQPKSIYKVRLFASAYIPVAHSLRYNRMDDFGGLLNIATGAAIRRSEAGTGGECSRAEAEACTTGFLSPLVAMISIGLKTGPIDATHVQEPPHICLVNTFERILSEAISLDLLNTDVRNLYSLVCASNVEFVHNDMVKFLNA